MADEYEHLKGFSFEDYAKRALPPEDGLDEEITQAETQQEERLSTPEVDWEKRYLDMEQHNSRQAQELGHLRKENHRYKDAFDDYLVTPTPNEEPLGQVHTPLTSDDLLDRPEEVINNAIDNHPAIREAKEANERRVQQAVIDAQTLFVQRHPNYQETMSDPAFKEWVGQSGTRLGLAHRADQYDYEAADALFSLFTAEQALKGITQEQTLHTALENATLESAGIGEPAPDPKYSRHDMREVMIAKNRGDAKAERYLQIHLPMYRAALAAGEVTD